MGVGADEAGDDGFAGAVDAFGAGWDFDFVGGAGGEDGVAPDDEGGVVDFR